MMNRLRKALALGSASVLTAAFAVQARAQDLLGQPTPRGIDLQPAASSLKHDAIFFHNVILLPIITAISVFVLGLLIWIVVRYNRKASPTPAKWAHNTVIEVIWTVLPVLILMLISVWSFRLLYAYHDMPKPDLTVKVTGNQWYWSYEYPDNGGYAFDSHQLPEAEAKAKGVPFRLAADNPLVVPVGKTVRVLVTGADVIHAFALPAFGNKVDAIPGRVNETWFKAEKPGVYYGQCSELCGVDHAFMPIQIDVLEQSAYDAWIAARAPAPAPAAAAPAATEATTAAPAAAGPVEAPAGPTAGAAPAAPIS
ncbi:MAG: cytochrome c oxidase subunit II [Caulobacterales bacterium 32-69-10]|nr:MAG: cytochrome c oxidase subunit II [Caulobacterales bacterium 32-69-10]